MSESFLQAIKKQHDNEAAIQALQYSRDIKYLDYTCRFMLAVPTIGCSIIFILGLYYGLTINSDPKRYSASIVLTGIGGGFVLLMVVIIIIRYIVCRKECLGNENNLENSINN